MFYEPCGWHNESAVTESTRIHGTDIYFYKIYLVYLGKLGYLMYHSTDKYFYRCIVLPKKFCRTIFLPAKFYRYIGLQIYISINKIVFILQIYISTRKSL